MPKQRSESVNDKCAVCSKATGDNWLYVVKFVVTGTMQNAFNCRKKHTSSYKI